MDRPSGGKMHSRTATLLLVVPAILCAFRPAGAVDWKRPLTWITDQFNPAGTAAQPEWERVLFWDESIGQERGLRVALMPVVQNKENESIDWRMAIQMRDYMSNFCDQVVTVLDIEDPYLRDRLDQVLKTCIRQWKELGRIEPKTVIPAKRSESGEDQFQWEAQIQLGTIEDVLSYMTIDAVVLFERSIYDQGWRGDRKIFRVGLLGAAFALDTGSMILLHEALEESPWSGMRNTIARVERLAIRSFLDRLHNRLVEIAGEIDVVRQAQMKETRQAEEERERERLAQLAREEEELRRLTAEASAVLIAATEPQRLIDQIRGLRETVAKSLRRPSAEQTQEEVEARRRSAAELRNLLAQYRERAAEQERVSRLPPPDQPLEVPSRLPGSEEPPVDGLLIDFSSLTTPVVTPAATPPYSLPPGVFNLPPRRPRRVPLPPLRSTLPTPTPTAASQAQRVEFTEELPLSATAAVPATAPAMVPLPAGATMAEGTAGLSPATPPLATPPSETSPRDIEPLQHGNPVSGRPAAPLKLGEAALVGEATSAQNVNQAKQ